MPTLHTIEDWRRLAAAQYAGGDFPRALATIREALAVAPDDPGSLNMQGAILAAMGRADAALRAFDRAIVLSPGFLPALGNRATALLDLERPFDALAAFDRVIGLAPDHLEARLARADLLRRAGRLTAALQDLEHVLQLDPTHPVALQNSASILHMRGELEPALARFERLLEGLRGEPAAAATFDYALGMAVSCRRSLCDWNGMAELERRVTERVLGGASAFKPFLSLMISDDPLVHALCARRTFATREAPAPCAAANAAPPAAARDRRPRRLRIGYLSGDFRNHPTAWLIAGLIEAHDRSRFEVLAYSASPDDGSAMRRRLAGAFDGFVDISTANDGEAARLIAGRGVDILIDLSGQTDWHRGGVIARRPAPLQAHYLGYPGPPGVPAIDYFVADGTVLPRSDDALYGCAIARLPWSYQVNDRLPGEVAGTPSRESVGLPPDGMVYCGFCQPVKLSAEVFDDWMGILRAVPGSVLWLLEAGPQAGRNLRAAAAAHDIDPARLIFAPRVEHAAHLARLALADLLLDTWPCGAHTTASDALRVCVPFVTQPGRSFASRVGASLLHALGLPELITATRAGYAALAVDLGREPARLAATRSRLMAQLPASPLFDTDRFRAYFETALGLMWQRHADGLAPASFEVPP
ncbi:MAG: tetratricopeptide repeat protein [Steroidobacteraceae bacterium]|nr:tetratricopeptide repeat protein [Steroidobacteraceae bacterium]